MYITVPFCQYCFSCFHKVLVSIVTLKCVGIIHLFIVKCSPCGNSDPIVNFQFHHVATQILVTAPNL